MNIPTKTDARYTQEEVAERPLNGAVGKLVAFNIYLQFALNARNALAQLKIAQGNRDSEGIKKWDTFAKYYIREAKRAQRDLMKPADNFGYKADGNVVEIVLPYAMRRGNIFDLPQRPSVAKGETRYGIQIPYESDVAYTMNVRMVKHTVILDEFGNAPALIFGDILGDDFSYLA